MHRHDFRARRRDLGVSSALQTLAERAGVNLRIPDGIGSLCCGTPWKSEGLTDGYDEMKSRVLPALWEATEHGRLDVVCDGASCTEGLEHLVSGASELYPGLRIIDAIEFAELYIIGHLEVTERLSSLALHPTCSSTRLGTNDALTRIGRAVADEVVIPDGWRCCAFAGDRGMLHPELTASATPQRSRFGRGARIRGLRLHQPHLRARNDASDGPPIPTPARSRGIRDSSLDHPEPLRKMNMRALVLKEFGQLEIEDRPVVDPGPGEVQLRILATGICGSDIHGFTGRNGRRVPGQIMGHEAVGRILALGEETEGLGLEIGSLATFNPVILPVEDLSTYSGREQHSPNKKVIGVSSDIVSAFAQIICVPARNVVPLPDSMPVSYGALIEPIAVAVHAVRRAGVKAGDNVLVVGGGPIGQCVILEAQRQGAKKVAVSELDPARRALCERLGATVIEPGGEVLAERVTAVLGCLADVALDAVGMSTTLSDALNATVFGGTVCLVGMASPNLSLDAFRVSTEERTLVGSFSYSIQEFEEAANWVATAPAELARLISREVSLDEAQEAFAGLARMDGTPGKVLVLL